MGLDSGFSASVGTKSLAVRLPVVLYVVAVGADAMLSVGGYMTSDAADAVASVGVTAVVAALLVDAL